MSLIDRRHLKERGVYCHNCNKLKNANVFRQKYQENLKITEYPIHQLIRLGRLEVHIALSNPNIDVKILAQGY